MSYEVYLYAIPRVSADGKQSFPGPECKKQEFGSADDARRFAIENKETFDRVVVMENENNVQKVLEHFVDSIEV
jgi:hypothetical protein